ncbi:MAG: hypothetical protein NTY34_05380 [Candidatus Omnitrophica bacterium]|nr:hypothetical protein [Candidatus Omnitrophota bacterium]
MKTMNKKFNRHGLDKKLLKDLYFKKKNSLNQIGSRFHIHPFSVWKLMDKFELKRRNSSEAVYNYFNKKECFKVRENLQSLKLLKNTGLVLYWCEGTGDRSDAKKNTTLAFTNTDITMLNIWIKFLLEVCGLDKKKIKVRIYLHKNQNGNRLREYWSKKLSIPLSQFENVSYTRKESTQQDYKGTVKIKVHNLKLYLLVKAWIESLKRKISETYKIAS